MDYDKTNMPAAYDAGRGYSPAVLGLWLDVISRWVPKGDVSEILDIGCGTGRYSMALAAHFGARVVAVDPSGKDACGGSKKGNGTGSVRAGLWRIATAPRRIHRHGLHVHGLSSL